MPEPAPDTDVVEAAAAPLVGAASTPWGWIIALVLAFFRVLMSLFNSSAAVTEGEISAYDTALGEGSGAIIGGVVDSFAGTFPTAVAGIVGASTVNELGGFSILGGKTGALQSAGGVATSFLDGIAGLPWWVLAGGAYLLLKN